MSYKISGTTNENSRIIVIKEDDWSIETTQSGVVGDFSVEGLTEGNKIIITRNDIGYVVGFGNVYPIKAAGDIGVFTGGATGTATVNSTMDYITISTMGNASDFGDITSVSRFYVGSTSNGQNNRGVICGGRTNSDYTSAVNNIDYITISSAGDTSDFGDLTSNKQSSGVTSNNSNNRGVIGGNITSTYYNDIDYITISTTGDATDFGDLTISRGFVASTSNGTSERGIFGGGYSTGRIITIDYITISNTGNASDFGDLPTSTMLLTATSNNTTGLFAGGYVSSYQNVISYVTISTTSNTSDFGDLTVARGGFTATSNCSDDTGVFAGGFSATNIMDYVTISTTGNASDFGDLTVARGGLGSASNA